jgi:hypothetical protein
LYSAEVSDVRRAIASSLRHASWSRIVSLLDGKVSAQAGRLTRSVDRVDRAKPGGICGQFGP